MSKHCYKCGADGPDSSGRCWDCVQRDFYEATEYQRDKRSMWKLRDIEIHEAEVRKYGKAIKQ